MNPGRHRNAIFGSKGFPGLKSGGRDGGESGDRASNRMTVTAKDFLGRFSKEQSGPSANGIPIPIGPLCRNMFFL